MQQALEWDLILDTSNTINTFKIDLINTGLIKWFCQVLTLTWLELHGGQPCSFYVNVLLLRCRNRRLLAPVGSHWIGFDWIDVRKFVFGNRVVNDWNSLSSQCVNCCTVKTVKNILQLNWNWELLNYVSCVLFEILSFIWRSSLCLLMTALSSTSLASVKSVKAIGGRLATSNYNI